MLQAHASVLPPYFCSLFSLFFYLLLTSHPFCHIFTPFFLFLLSALPLPLYILSLPNSITKSCCMLHGLQCFPEIRVTCCLLSKSVWQASIFSCQSKLQTSTHHSVIGADEKKTVTSILTWAFRNNPAAPSILTPSAWQSHNNTNRCDFQMQNEAKSVVCSHLLPFSQWYKKSGKVLLWIIKFKYIFTYNKSYSRQLKARESDTHSGLYTHTFPTPLWAFLCWHQCSSPGTSDGSVPCSTVLWW